MLSKQTVNKVILMGRISSEPCWHTIDGQRILYFRLLTIERIKNGEPPLEEWHEIRVPDRITLSEKLSRGMVAYIQGHLRTRMFTDQNMVKHYRTEVVATNVEVFDLVPAAAQEATTQ